MLKKLIIKNILSHKKTTLKFHPGVNIIVGRSDSGKSAIISALQWLCQNKPPLSDISSHWSNDNIVKGVFDNGSVIRARKSGQSYYKADGEKYTGFGTNTPQPIIDLIKMDEGNFLLQGDPHFMLDWTPGKRAEYINRITDLQIIDKATKYAQIQIRDQKATKKAVESALEDKQKELKEFMDVEAANKDLKVIENLYTRYEKIDKEHETLIDFIMSLNENKQQIMKYRHARKDQESLKIIDSLQAQLKTCDTKIEQMDNLILDHMHTIKKIKKLSEEIERIETEYNSKMPKTCPLCGNMKG